MAVRELYAFFNDDFVGVLLETSDGSLSFVYDDDWRFASDSTSLSLSMPLTRRQYDNDVVGPFVDGLLPDNDEVRERWGRWFHVSARNPFALLTHVGADVVGSGSVSS